MLAPVEAGGKRRELQVERRQSVRQRLTMRVAKLRCGSGEYACVVHDVSETGARLRLFHAHPPDTHMFLELANGRLYAAERRWIDGDFCGCRFSGAIEVDEFLHEPGIKPRRPLRLRLEHPVQIVSGGERGQAYMMDISLNGACVEAGRRLAVGALLNLEIPGTPPRHAHVCWRRNYRHGLAFQQAFALDDLARLALLLQPFDPARAVVAPAGDPAQSACA